MFMAKNFLLEDWNMMLSNDLHAALVKASELTEESPLSEAYEVVSDWTGASIATLIDANEGDEEAQQRVHDSIFLSMRKDCGPDMGLFLYCQMIGMVEQMEEVGKAYAERLGL